MSPETEAVVTAALQCWCCFAKSTTGKNKVEYFVGLHSPDNLPYSYTINLLQEQNELRQ